MLDRKRLSYVPSGSKASEKAVSKKTRQDLVLSLAPVSFAQKEMTNEDEYWIQVREHENLMDMCHVADIGEIYSEQVGVERSDVSAPGSKRKSKSAPNSVSKRRRASIVPRASPARDSIDDGTPSKGKGAKKRKSGVKSYVESDEDE
jgi:hypothetical protein